jgi:predicted Fe-Mo cluster-binding NifX family protein
MKVAVPTRGSNVDDHFGHCEVYTIFTLDENHKISHTEKLPSPQGCGCKSNIAAVLHQKGVNVLLAGNMGGGAYNVLNYHGINVYRGCKGDVRKAVEDFAEGLITDSNENCKSHELHNREGHGHVCNH